MCQLLPMLCVAWTAVACRSQEPSQSNVLSWAFWLMLELTWTHVIHLQMTDRYTCGKVCQWGLMCYAGFRAMIMGRSFDGPWSIVVHVETIHQVFKLLPYVICNKFWSCCRVWAASCSMSEQIGVITPYWNSLQGQSLAFSWARCCGYLCNC